MRGGLAALGVAAVLLTGCGGTAGATPGVVGDAQVLCGRVPRGLAEKAVGRSIDQLRLLDAFNPRARDGECALSDASGTVLDVSVVPDKGHELQMRLRELAPIANYAGDEVSAVAGEGNRTDAFVAVDKSHYVWVQLNTGSSDEQRTACLALAFEVATATLKIG